MSIVVVTRPAFFAVSLAEALIHLRLVGDADGYVAGFVLPGAQALVEELTGRRLTTTTLRLGLETWPAGGEILLPGPPAASITSVTYLDGAGVRQTLAASNYVLDKDAEPAILAPAAGVTWPSARQASGSVQVTYVAGASSAADVEPSLRAAVLLACGHKYEHRELAIPGTSLVEVPVGIRDLCAPYDVRDRFA